jgi:hypothetical protein
MSQRTNYSILTLLLISSFFPLYFFSSLTKDIAYIDSHKQLAQAASTLSNGLVAHYRFDEGSGTTATDSAGTNTGTLTNGPTFTTGKVGSGALSFDGVNDYVKVGDVGAVDGLQKMSVAYWVNPGALKLRAYHVTKANAAATVFGWAVHATDDTNDIRFQTRSDAGAVADGYTTGSFLTANSWTHVAVVFDGSQSDNASKLKIYINGSEKVLNFTGTLPSTLPDTAFNLVFGWEHNTASGLSFPGQLDDIRIYNRTLSSSEVLDAYNYSESAPSTPSNPPPTPSPTNQPPIVSAGANQTITLPQNLPLQTILILS